MFSFIFLFIFAFTQCISPDENEKNLKRVAREVNDRKVKRVVEKDLRKWIHNKGTEICRVLQKNLIKKYRLEKSNQKVNAINDFYKIENLAGLDSLREMYQVDVQKIPFENPEKIKLNTIEQKNLLQFNSQESSQEPILEVDYPDYYFLSPIILENKIVGMWRVKFVREQAIRFYDFREL
ncbi:MAG: hypothetical protein EAZ85_00510 [Bacteroidetes bacterium]|nr:MAG: hypothetical protein EAZ85_00510 [Bacteroidota bacterium]TAG89348.1 MAG: hypothetical protein EAZ20_06650 [Bacteroidota bacterium]